MATHPVFLPGESHAQRSLVGCKESDMTERLTLIAMENIPARLQCVVTPCSEQVIHKESSLLCTS